MGNKRKTPRETLPKSRGAPASADPRTGLTPQRERFCLEYVKNGGRKSDAYRIAFPKSANWTPQAVHSSSGKLLEHPRVRARIAEFAAMLEERVGTDAAEVLQSAVRAMRSDITLLRNDDGTWKPQSEWPAWMRLNIESIKTEQVGSDAGPILKMEVKMRTKDGAENRLMKYFGMFEKDNLQKRNPFAGWSADEVKAFREFCESESTGGDQEISGGAPAGPAATTH